MFVSVHEQYCSNIVATKEQNSHKDVSVSFFTNLFCPEDIATKTPELQYIELKLPTGETKREREKE